MSIEVNKYAGEAVMSQELKYSKNWSCAQRVCRWLQQGESVIDKDQYMTFKDEDLVVFVDLVVGEKK